MSLVRVGHNNCSQSQPAVYASAASGSSQGAAQQDAMLERVLIITGLFLEAVLCLGEQSELIPHRKMGPASSDYYWRLCLPGRTIRTNSTPRNGTSSGVRLYLFYSINGVSRQSREAVAARAQVGGRTPCMGQYNTCCTCALSLTHRLVLRSAD